MGLLYILRHADVIYQNNSLDKYVNLSEKGKSQIKLLTERWDFSIDLVFSSPLPRALESVDLLARKYNIPINIENGLEELNYAGDASIFHKRIETDKNFKYAGGETISEASDRFQRAVVKLASSYSDEVLLLSTHGTVLSEFLKSNFNYPQNCYFGIRTPDVFKVEYDSFNSKFVSVCKNVLVIE